MDLHAVKLQAVDWATTYSIFNFRLFGPKVKAAPKKVRPARPWSYLDFEEYKAEAAVNCQVACDMISCSGAASAAHTLRLGKTTKTLQRTTAVTTYYPSKTEVIHKDDMVKL